MWVLCYTISKVEFMLRVDFEKYGQGFFWTESEPLENLGQGYHAGEGVFTGYPVEII